MSLKSDLYGNNCLVEVHHNKIMDGSMQAQLKGDSNPANLSLTQLPLQDSEVLWSWAIAGLLGYLDLLLE